MGIAAVDMSEKNNNSPADNTKSEKKMTKYDLKMQRRQEEEKKAKKEKAIIKTGCILAVIICVCIAAWKFYDNYQEKHGPYITVGDHEIQKAEFDYYYYSSLNSFASTYGSYLSYFGLDTSKPLDQQQYSDTMTWDDYFQQQAVNQLKNVYALTDEANEKGFEYDASSDYDDMVTSIKSYAQQQGVSEDEYCKSVFGSDATLEGIKPYVEMSGLASAYYNDVKDDIEVPDDEINTYYDENKDNYDSVDYRVCKIEADMPEEETETETEAQTETAAESISETAAESTSETAVTETQIETESETMSAEESEAAAKAEEEAKEAAMAEAKAKADDMLSKITDEASFEKVYGDYATDASTDSLNTGKKKSSISPTDVANWLFDADRQAGDTTVIEDTANNAYYVVYFKDRYLDHIKTVDVRQILISADTSSSDAAETDETETTAAGETETAETESAEAQEQAKEDAKAAAKIKAEQILVTENPHYDGLKHRRSVFFVDQSYFVIVDEAVGNAQGVVNLNYHLCEGTVNIDRKNNMLTTVYDGPSNVKLQCFAEKKISMKEKEGWRSTAYRLRVPRTTVSFDIDKKDSDAVRYITILYPSKNTASFPIFKAKFLNKAFDENGVKIEISVGGKKRQLEYKL